MGGQANAIKTLADVAEFIKSDQCRSVVMLTGAGVSCASGIPDFRSPGGMYNTLRPELITATPAQRSAMADDPTNVVEKGMFMQTAFPYLEVRRPFILGTRDRQWRATLAHWFAALLHQKTGKLTRVFTQNIDGLDYQVDGLPARKLCNVHGTIAEVACESCGNEMDFGEFCDKVQANIKDIYGIDAAAPKASTPIRCKKCNQATVKPKTVLFGGSLPGSFFKLSNEELPKADLLIVAGTSLVVSPANGVVNAVSKRCVRVICNREPVGQSLGIRYDDAAPRDVFAQGDTDDAFAELSQHLGWLDDLAAVADRLPAASAAALKKFSTP
eukprot:TRINITY_DN22283_c0_g1_i1.p1 TRINITY_DN22283_c0_g1~~TRINITY_DN22283_c0_g1_i1.p1  ORF type:complete len:328 (+),score=113.97 TRINITY_DN22283_c0_g1_i1:91-1074(+)